MVEDLLEMDRTFRALAHSARRSMLRRLASQDLTVGELAEPLKMSLAGASKHVQVLIHTGLVKRTVVGRRHVCRLEPTGLAAASEWLRFYERFWQQSLDALEDLLAPEHTPEEETK